MSINAPSARTRAMTPEMAQHLAGCYPRVDRRVVSKIYEALTSDGVSVPILRFVAIVDMIDRYLENDPENYFASMRSAGFHLSAISHDATHRLQTEQLRVLHDVMVEMFMPGPQYRRLQRLLDQQLGVQLATYGDCGCCTIPTSELEQFEADFKEEQALRTHLECESYTRMVDGDQIVSDARYTERERGRVELLFRIAGDLAMLAQLPMAHPEPTERELTLA